MHLAGPDPREVEDLAKRGLCVGPAVARRMAEVDALVPADDSECGMQLRIACFQA